VTICDHIQNGYKPRDPERVYCINLMSCIPITFKTSSSICLDCHYNREVEDAQSNIRTSRKMPGVQED